jgi:hypothetical protein
MTIKNPQNIKNAIELMNTLDQKNRDINVLLGKLRRSIGNECVEWVKNNPPADDYVMWLDMAEVALWFLEDKYKGVPGIKETERPPGRYGNKRVVLSIDHKTGKNAAEEVWDQLKRLKARISDARDCMPGGLDAMKEAVAS